MKEFKTSDGTIVTVTPMEAYPDGCLLAAELGALVLPVVGALPPGTLGILKDSVADGNATAAIHALLKIDGESGDGLLAKVIGDGLSKVLVQLTDRERFLRLSGQLFATMVVRHEGRQVELLDQDRIRRVVGGNIRRVGELLAIALRGNLLSFSSGAGETSDDSASGQ